jgi:predicted DNA-binding transcriptional regulator AlpA
MQHEILLLPELAARLRVSPATVNRLLAQRRKGVGNFPLPLSTFKGKGRWLASDVDRYLEQQATVNVIAAPVKSEKERAKEFIARQKRAQATLATHGIESKGGGV